MPTQVTFTATIVFECSSDNPAQAELDGRNRIVLTSDDTAHLANFRCQSATGPIKPPVVATPAIPATRTVTQTTVTQPGVPLTPQQANPAPATPA